MRFKMPEGVREKRGGEGGASQLDATEIREDNEANFNYNINK